MPYRCKKNADVEYFEPRIEIPYNALDIADYIRSLKEPERSICTAVILDGEHIKHVASDCKVSRKSIMQIMRSALLPLAEELGIVPSIPVEEPTLRTLRTDPFRHGPKGTTRTEKPIRLPRK